MASLLSHKLNQPLAAIASYAAGSLNLLGPDGVDAASARMLRQAAQRIAAQAERAGRVIKSVHDFTRRREWVREAIRADALVDTVLPLVRLQARKSGTRVDANLPESVPRVLCDRTMLEQVLLNLTRIGVQAMVGLAAVNRRVLGIRVRQNHARWVSFEAIDCGPRIAPEVAQRLFTLFFTTRAEGMGLRLGLCRTVIEQHGGALEFENLAKGTGTVLRFTLPSAASGRDASSATDPIEATSAH